MMADGVRITVRLRRSRRLRFCAPAAAAHPHVWIEMSSDVVFDDKGMVTAVNIEWTFDDGYAQMALDGLDTDGDGVYSATELEALTRENMDSLKDYDYFLHAFADGKPLRILPAKDAGQIYSNQRLTLYFTVPLETPVDPSKKRFLLSHLRSGIFHRHGLRQGRAGHRARPDAGRLQARSRSRS